MITIYIITIQVLWKEIQALQNENEMEYNNYEGGHPGHPGHPGHRARAGFPGEKSRGYGSEVHRATLSKSMRVTERKLSRLLQVFLLLNNLATLVDIHILGRPVRG